MGSGCGNSLARTVTLCGRWKIKVNSMWLWWYCALVLAGMGYLIYRAVEACKEFNELPWNRSEKPVLELYVYITLIVVSVMCIPFLVITSVFRTGNYANDGMRLGRDTTTALRPDMDSSASSNDIRSGSGEVTWAQSLWRHSGPLCHGFHIFAAFILLFPKVLLEAQKIKYGFTSPDAMWQSDLDGFFVNSRRTSHEKMEALFTNDIPSPSRNLTNPADQSPYSSMTTSPEFINYILALIVYSLRYASVFWYTKMAFSYIFAFILMVYTLQFAFSYCGICVLYKFSMNASAVRGLSLLLPASVTLVLYLLACAVMHFSTVTIFNYGYAHFIEKWQKFLITHFPLLSRRINPEPTMCCQGYVPNIIATLCLVIVIGLRAPVIYDYVMLYRTMVQPLILVCIILDAISMFFWIIIWFGFTVKQTWDFKILLMRKLEQELASSQPAVYTIHSDHLRNNKLEGEPLKSSLSPMLPNGMAKPLGQHMQKASSEPRGNDMGNTKSGDSIGKGDHPPVRRVKSDSMPKQPHDKSLDVTMDDSTLDSTLTRNYRHSIRDICGYYYYRQDQDIPEHPSPQNSPRPHPEPMIMPPLQPHRSLPNVNEGPQKFFPNFPDQNYVDPAPYRHSVHLPQYNPHRPTRVVDVPPRYANLPFQGSPQPKSLDRIRNETDNPRSSREITGNQIPEAAPSTRPLRDFLESNAPLSKPINKRIDFSKPEPRMTDTISRPPPRSALPARGPDKAPTYENFGHSRNSAEDPYRVRRSQSPPNVRSQRGNYQNFPTDQRPPEVPSREGRMKRSLSSGRDSALPSSNDTSSNESHENVLCSQV